MARLTDMSAGANAAPDDPVPSRWLEVLAECEATAAAAEALLDVRSAFDAERFAALAVRDLWQLSLPALPADLRARAQDLHRRQVRLQAELQSAMRGLAQQILLAQQLQLSNSAEPSQAPRYLDRSA